MLRRWLESAPAEHVRQRPFPELLFEPDPLPRLSFSAIPALLDRSAAVPPSCQAHRHRRTDPGITRRSCDLIDPIATGQPLGCLQPHSPTPLLLGGVYPPRFANRMPWSYAGNQPTSRLELYELILVSREPLPFRQRHGHPRNVANPGHPGCRSSPSVP